MVKNNYEYRYRRGLIRIDLVQEADGVNVLSCNGLRYPYEITQQSANTYSITLNGVSYNFSVETPFSLTRKRMLAAKAGLSKKEVIKAPMPADGGKRRVAAGAGGDEDAEHDIDAHEGYGDEGDGGAGQDGG